MGVRLTAGPVRDGSKARFMRGWTGRHTREGRRGERRENAAEVSPNRSPRALRGPRLSHVTLCGGL